MMPSEVYERITALEQDVAELWASVAMDETIHVYEDRCRFDKLVESTPSAWTNGTFDKGKLAFMLDDARSDVGYVAAFLSSEYGFPMGFAVPYNKIGGELT